MGEAETPSCRKTMGRVVSHPCLHCQQMAGPYLFTKVKVNQTPSSFWWLGQLLQKGICREAMKPLPNHTAEVLLSPALALFPWPCIVPWVGGKQHSHSGVAALVTIINCSSHPWGSCQVGVTPPGEALKTAAGMERSSCHQWAHRCWLWIPCSSAASSLPPTALHAESKLYPWVLGLSI